jgi:hypothetical protein
MIIFLTLGLVLTYLFYRMFPLTVTAIVGSIVFLAYAIFVKDWVQTDTMTATIGTIIILAFCLDIGSRVLGLFRARP